MEDNIFGTMTFKRGWTKQEKLLFWGEESDVKIRISCYPGEEPNDNQKKAYESFISNIQEISEDSLVKLAMFVSKDPEAGLPSNLESAVSELPGHLHIFEILFFKDGSYAIICDCNWTEDGVSVLIKDGRVEVGYSEELLDGRI